MKRSVSALGVGYSQARIALLRLGPCRVLHPQRLEDVLPDVILELLARQLLDERGLDIDPEAVPPLGARLVRQWHRGHAMAELGQIVAGVERVGGGKCLLRANGRLRP